MKKYKIIALIGEAGAGKDYIMSKVVEAMPSLHEIVSCTTRPQREGEYDGVNYFFLTIEQFTQKVINGEMLEATCFNDWFYGTSFDSLRSDCVNIGVFNPDGIDSLMLFKDILDIYVFYIKADDKTRLIRQLNRESKPNVLEIIRRFQADLGDFDELEFHHNELENNNEDDLKHAIDVIVHAATALENQ